MAAIKVGAKDAELVSGLRPSLWRTARCIANRGRLRILRHACHHPGATVSEFAGDLQLSQSLASQGLRALNARGLLQVRRESRWVRYWPIADDSIPAAVALTRALRVAYMREKASTNTLFLAATAFTHPRRCLLLRVLHTKRATMRELKQATGISNDALRRHLQKLRRRKLIVKRDHHFACVRPRGALAAAFLALAQSDE